MASLKKQGPAICSLLLTLLGLTTVLGLVGMSGARAAPSPGPSCALLDDPAARGLMSGAFELALLEACGRPPSGPASQSGGAPRPAAVPPAGVDLRVNDIDPPVTQTTQSETSIAVNPLSGTLCVTYNDTYHRMMGQGTSGFSRSTDGGLTWQDGGPMPSGDGGVSRGDPSVAWRELDGHFYYASLHTSGLGLWRSADDCATFQWVGMIHSGGSDDKEFMAVDNNPTSPYYGRFYVAWTELGAGRILFSRSDDGLAWTTPLQLSPGIAFGAWPAVAPNGDLYVAWVRWHSYPYGNIDQEVTRSADGGDSFSPVTSPLVNATLPREAQASALCGRPALRGKIRYFPMPQLVVGPDNCLHIVYSYDPDGYALGDVVNVYTRRSCDQGGSWGPEVQLNDDGGLTDQFFPAITVSPDNILAASWYDRRLDPEDNTLFDRYWSASYDGGVTWEPNARISDVSSPVYIWSTNCYHGDYDQMAAHGESVYHLWSDDRLFFNGHYDPDVWFDQVSVAPDFTLSLVPSHLEVCRPGLVSSTIALGVINHYSQPVTLSESGVPAGFDTTFTLNPVGPLPGQSSYLITATGVLSENLYAWTVSGAGPTRTHSSTLTLRVDGALPPSATLLSPADGAQALPSNQIVFRWSELPQAGRYRLQVDDDPAFDTPALDLGGLTAAVYTSSGELAPGASYYWRVGGANGCGEGPYSPAFGFSTQAPSILLVDDDDDDPDLRQYYSDALTNLGCAFHLYDVGGGAADGPELALMQDYRMLIWFSGDKWGDGGSAGPSAADEAALSAYLEGGGRLFLSSQDYLYDFGLTPFARDYLGVESFIPGAGDAASILGLAGDPIGDGLGPYPLSYPPNMLDHGDRVTPGPAASLAFEGDSGHPLDIDRDGGAWRTVFFGTSWAPVAFHDPAAGEAVLDRVVDWFGGCVCRPVTDTLMSWEPVTPTVGRPVTFVGQAAGWQPISYTWSFGDGAGGSGAVVTHSYALSGSYPVLLTATNPCGEAQASDTITVEPADLRLFLPLIWRH